MIHELTDLVFLDIQMPKLTGFELLEVLEYHPAIIFTTAYDQFAIKAFKHNAIDYLLKPYTQERFSLAVTKALQQITAFSRDNTSKITKIVNTISQKEEYLDRIAIKNGTKISVVALDNIFYLEADGDYVMIYTHEGRFLKEKTMKYFETHLNPMKFIRIHRSYIVNIDEVIRLENFDKTNYIAILKNGTKLKVSDNGYKLLKQNLKF